MHSDERVRSWLTASRPGNVNIFQGKIQILQTGFDAFFITRLGNNFG